MVIQNIQSITWWVFKFGQKCFQKSRTYIYQMSTSSNPISAFELFLCLLIGHFQGIKRISLVYISQYAWQNFTFLPKKLHISSNLWLNSWVKRLDLTLYIKCFVIELGPTSSLLMYAGNQPLFSYLFLHK